MNLYNRLSGTRIRFAGLCLLLFMRVIYGSDKPASLPESIQTLTLEIEDLKKKIVSDKNYSLQFLNEQKKRFINCIFFINFVSMQ